MLGFYKSSKTKMIRTKLKKGDVIGYDASHTSRSIKILRPSKGNLIELYFKEGSDLSKNFRWPLNKEEFELLVNLMAASAGYNKAFKISCDSHLHLAWAYHID